jgi:hypothetical protein
MISLNVNKKIIWQQSKSLEDVSWCDGKWKSELDYRIKWQWKTVFMKCVVGLVNVDQGEIL